MLLLIAVWVAMTFVGFVVTGVIQDSHLQKGNPYRLTNPIDYNGNLCGFDSGLHSKKYAYYLPGLTGECVMFAQSALISLTLKSLFVFIVVSRSCLCPFMSDQK
jgi:hypothetical protein